MWICLNPEKGPRFTTKGINLYKGAPTAFVGPDTSSEVMSTINAAIQDGRIIRIQGNEMGGMTIQNQASIEDEYYKETDTVIKYKSGLVDGKRVTIIAMPDEDGNLGPVQEPKQTIILTDIEETPRDEDEDD